MSRTTVFRSHRVAALALLVVGAVVTGGCGRANSSRLGEAGDAAERVYVAPGKYDEFYAFMSGGFDGQVGVYGLPSGRLLKHVPVFAQNAENGWGYSEQTKAMMNTSYGFVPWDDAHHPQLSQTAGAPDGRWLFINGNNTPRIARLDLTRFETEEILEIPNSGGNHSSPFLTRGTTRSPTARHSWLGSWGGALRERSWSWRRCGPAFRGRRDPEGWASDHLQESFTKGSSSLAAGRAILVADGGIPLLEEVTMNHISCTDLPRERSGCGDEPLAAALRQIHDTLVEEARRFLEPATEPGADFWTRWAAVRYLSDDFRGWYRLERALVDELRSFLRPEVAERLVREGDRLFRLRLELDRTGRRRGTAAEVAEATRDLLEQLELWCADIEMVAAGLTRDALPAEATHLLAHLESAASLQR